MPNGKSIPVTRQSEDDVEAAKKRSRDSHDIKDFTELPQRMARIRAKGAADMQNAYGDQWSPGSPNSRKRKSRRIG